MCGARKRLQPDDSLIIAAIRHTTEAVSDWLRDLPAGRQSQASLIERLRQTLEPELAGLSPAQSAPA
jgi:hypothetical protein